MPLTFDEYQTKSVETAVYPGQGELIGLMYVGLGLAGEAGEVANKVKKIARDDDGTINSKSRDAIIEELGDVAWYMAMLCWEIGVPLEDVFASNLVKLADRRNRGVISGSGDNR